MPEKLIFDSECERHKGMGVFVFDDRTEMCYGCWLEQNGCLDAPEENTKTEANHESK